MHTTVVFALAVAIALAVVVAVAAAAGRDTSPRCTYGLSSIGPVELENGQIVGGDTVPHTEACLR